MDLVQVLVNQGHQLFVEGNIDQAKELDFLIFRHQLIILVIDVPLELSVEVLLNYLLMVFF